MAAEYVGAIAILVVSLLKTFGIFVPQDAVTGILTGAMALYIAIKRHGQGDITALGVKKVS